MRTSMARTTCLVLSLALLACGPARAQSGTVSPRPGSNGAVTPGPALAPVAPAPAPVQSQTAPVAPAPSAAGRTQPTPTAPVSDPQRARDTMNSGRNAFGCPDLDPLCQQQAR